MRMIIVGGAAVLAGALACTAAPVRAASGCTKASNYQDEGGLSGWPARVAASSNATLAAAYAAGTCQWLKGQHDGGSVPPNAPSSQHVTVTAGSKVCHVFKKKSGDKSPGYPTTCA